jgi:endonuclease G
MQLNKIRKCLFVAVFLTAAVSQTVFASETVTCHNFYQYGNPTQTVDKPIAKADQYLCRDGYVSAYSYTTKQPVAVAYHLTSKSVDVNIKRKDDFRPDPDVPAKYQSELSDYSRSGYDRGHLAPYAAMDFDKASADQSFLLSNMSPQKAGLNRDGWAKLESDVRDWANMYKSIWVYDGAIYKGGKVNKTIGKNKVAVPDYFFKVIYAPEKIQGGKAIAFIMPNAKVSRKNFAKYIVSINEVQQRTGLQFLTALPKDERTKLINAVSPMWSTKFNYKHARHH